MNGNRPSQELPRSSRTPVVYIVDEDDSVRRSVRSLFGAFGIDVRGFSTAEEFLDTLDEGRPGCLITEMRLNRMTGIQLQEHLRDRGIALPVIIMTSYADPSVSSRALRNGALDFIEKPFVDHALLNRVAETLGVSPTS